MRLVIISDTHGQHRDVELPEGDILIHCGDWSRGRGSGIETFDFATWLHRQDFKYKVVIAGNHDQFASPSYFTEPGVHYLQDSGVELEGLKFWGMPWTPTFYDWYWMKNRGAGMKKVCDLIPEDTEVLVTHGPQAHVFDQTEEGDFVGCQDLGMRLGQLPHLQLHCFGHIHEGYGDDQYYTESQQHDPEPYVSVNASVVNRQYQLVNEPIVVDL